MTVFFPSQKGIVYCPGIYYSNPKGGGETSLTTYTSPFICSPKGAIPKYQIYTVDQLRDLVQAHYEILVSEPATPLTVPEFVLLSIDSIPSVFFTNPHTPPAISVEFTCPSCLQRDKEKVRL